MSGKYLILCLILAASVILVSAAMVKAVSYGYTMVSFYIPTDTSFSVKILGQSAYNITATSEGQANVTSAWISFNATSVTQSKVQPLAKGVANTTNQQVDSGKPIFTFANTGTVKLNITIYWKTGDLPDPCIDVCANSTCGGSCSAAAFNYTCINISGYGGVRVATNLSVGEKANVSLYADFTSCNMDTFKEAGSKLYHRSN